MSTPDTIIPLPASTSAPDSSFAHQQPDRDWIPAAASLVQHELRNCLASVVGLAEAVSADLRRRMEEAEADLRHLQMQSIAAAELLRELLELTPHAGRPLLRREVIDAAPFLESIRADGRVRSGRAGACVEPGPAGMADGLVNSDEIKLRRCLGLLVQTLVAQHPGGSVDVVGSWTRTGLRIEVGASPGAANSVAAASMSFDPGPSRMAVAQGLAHLLGTPLRADPRPGRTVNWVIEVPTAEPGPLDSGTTSLEVRRPERSLETPSRAAKRIG